MEINKADIITFANDKYITLDVITYEGITYAFVNKITGNEEPTEELNILEVTDKLSNIKDDELANKLLKIFQENLEKEIQEILKEEDR